MPQPLRRRPAPSVRRPGFRCDALEPRFLLAAALVKDINPATPSSNPHAFVDLHGTLLFRADDGVHGQDWWRADGTAGGARLVKDAEGAGWTADGRQVPRTHAVMGGNLYFRGSNDAAGIELWKTDGTDAGTVIVKDPLAAGLFRGPRRHAVLLRRQRDLEDRRHGGGHRLRQRHLPRQRHKCHGARIGTFTNRFACSSPTICSLTGS